MTDFDDSNGDIVDSTDRRPLDYIATGLCGLGELVATAGVVTLHLAIFVVGGVFVALGMTYFLLMD